MLYKKEVIDRFWSKVDKRGDCWIWTAFTDKNGYGHFFPESRKRVSAHRFSYLVAHGNIPKADTRFGTANILHRCDNPSCVNPDHLFAGTEGDNARDRQKKGRSVIPDNSGGNHGMARLSEAEVIAARKSWIDGEPQASIARRLGLHPSTISRAVRGENWRHI